jgi:1-acyl-sn-glycerol-3-phosphate acyltransferase
MNRVPETRSRLWRFVQAIARLLTTLVFDLKVYGLENVPKTGGVLLLANHQSYLDPVLVAVQLRRPVAFMAKSELFTNRYFGWLIRALHAFPVRQTGVAKEAIQEAVKQLNSGRILNIYPEGSRSEDGEIAPIQKGVTLILRMAEVPIVPVAIDGSFDAWPKHNKLFRPHPVHVLIGKPLNITGLKGDKLVELIEQTLRSLLADLRTRR